MADSNETPYNLPSRLVYVGEHSGGPIVPAPSGADPVQIIDDIRAMEMKDDDVIVVAYRKCGTHWLWEMVNMLLQQSPTHGENAKEFYMIDYVGADHVKNASSPRVLNSHFYMSQLPAQAFEKKIKIVHPIRNPKDTLVSLYFHYRQITSNPLKMDDIVNAIIAGDQVCFGDQFSFLRQIEEFEKANPDYPIKHVYYEDVQEDPIAAVKELAQFLNVPASDQLCQEIADACHFDNMKKADENRKFPGSMLKKRLSLYRKGKVGDWKNHLTVRENEIVDAFIEKETAKGLKFKFRYE